MKNNKRLTLKMLQEQLNELKIKTVVPNNKKANNKVLANKAQAINKDIQPKISIINSLKSSMLVLYALSWVAFLAHKLPFLSKLVTIAKPFVAKTSFWSILILLRKGFIGLNALIGMWLMFKITGWDQGSFMSSCVAIGNSYIEFFLTFLMKAYNWLYDLFDHKVVPNFPQNPQNHWSVYNGWNTGPMKQNDFLSIAENAKSWYNSPYGNAPSTSWFDNWKTWLYIAGGIITITAIISGAYYLNSWWTTIPTTAPQTPPHIGTPVIDATTAANTTANANTNTSLIRTIGNVLVFDRIRNITNLSSSIMQSFLPSMDANEFKEMQYGRLPYSQRNHGIYPYQPYNPSDYWYNRLWTKVFGESAQEFFTRERLKTKSQMSASDYIPRSSTLMQSSTPSPASTNIALTPAPRAYMSDLPNSHGWTAPNTPYIKPSAPFKEITTEEIDHINNFASSSSNVSSFLGAAPKNINSMQEPLTSALHATGIKSKLSSVASTPNAPFSELPPLPSSPDLNALKDLDSPRDISRPLSPEQLQKLTNSPIPINIDDKIQPVIDNLTNSLANNNIPEQPLDKGKGRELALHGLGQYIGKNGRLYTKESSGVLKPTSDFYINGKYYTQSSLLESLKESPSLIPNHTSSLTTWGATNNDVSRELIDNFNARELGLTPYDSPNHYIDKNNYVWYKTDSGNFIRISDLFPKGYPHANHPTIDKSGKAIIKSLFDIGSEESRKLAQIAREKYSWNVNK